VSTPNFKDGKTTTKPALLFLLRRYKKKKASDHFTLPHPPSSPSPSPGRRAGSHPLPARLHHPTRPRSLHYYSLSTRRPPPPHRTREGDAALLGPTPAPPRLPLILLRAAPPRAPAPPPRGGVRAAARGGGGGGWPSSPRRDRLRRALRREGRLPQLCALRARSHSGSAYYSNWDSNRKFNNRFCIWFESTFGGSPCVFSQPASSLLILTLTHHVPPFFMEMHRERISSSAATTSTLL
jgi:hypothetical protein